MPCWRPTSDAETQAVALEQVIASVAGARKLRLVMLDACRDNPFEKTMQRTMALKLVSKGFSNIEPEAGFMVVYAAKHGETALDGDSDNSPFAKVLARDIKAPRSKCESCSTSSATTSERDQTHAAAVHLRLAARARGFLFRGGEVMIPHDAGGAARSQILMVRRRVSAVSNHVAPIMPAAILRDAALRGSSG